LLSQAQFAIIAPDTSAEEARQLAERLRHAAVLRLELPVTLSAGVTHLSSAANVRDLFHLADSALYWAKHNGRDQTVRYTPGAAQDLTDRQRQRQRHRAQTRAALLALVRAFDAKEPGGQDHAGRVAEIAGALALRLGWSLERCAELREAALLHDIGKIAIPNAILNKPGRLTAEEYEQVKTHAQLGAEIASGALNDTQTSWLRSHHETPDGTGYPDALPAASIPDGAQLIAIADAFDAITTGRPYQAAIPTADALLEMRARAGTQFDPSLLDLLETYLHNTDKADTTNDPEATRTHTQ
jgi:putative nucleotidyltransferase with HDIG domain